MRKISVSPITASTPKSLTLLWPSHLCRSALTQLHLNVLFKVLPQHLNQRVCVLLTPQTHQRSENLPVIFWIKEEESSSRPSHYHHIVFISAVLVKHQRSIRMCTSQMVTLSSFLGDHHNVFGKHVVSLSILFWPAVQKRTLGLNLRIMP